LIHKQKKKSKQRNDRISKLEMNSFISPRDLGSTKNPKGMVIKSQRILSDQPNGMGSPQAAMAIGGIFGWVFGAKKRHQIWVPVC